MAKQTDVRPKITLACVECKERNYITRKNRRNDPDRLELKKYCPRDRRHTAAPRDPLATAPVRTRRVRLRIGSAPCRSTRRTPGAPTRRPTPTRSGVEKIREFADAIGDPNPAYRDRGGRPRARPPGRDRAADVPVRADLPGRRARSIADPELGLDYSRVVHGEQRFALHAGRSAPATRSP